MAEEGQAQTGVETPVEEQTDVTQPPEGTQEGEGASQAQTVQGDEPEDREPGGDSPQDVYRRKLYREAKRAREEAQREREARIAAEARARTLEESGKAAQQPQQKIYTAAELETAVDAGTISRREAEEYKANVLTPHLIQQEIEKRERAKAYAEAASRPALEASNEVKKYVELAPWVTDSTDARRHDLEVAAQDIMQRFGMPYSPVVEALALRQVLGPVSKLEERKRMQTMTRNNANTHAETGAGGSGESRLATNLVSKVPKSLVQDWRNMGATEKQIESYAKRHLEKIERRRGKFGA